MAKILFSTLVVPFVFFAGELFSAFIEIDGLLLILVSFENVR